MELGRGCCSNAHLVLRRSLYCRRSTYAPMCSCCLVSHICREPEAETEEAAGASEAGPSSRSRPPRPADLGTMTRGGVRRQNGRFGGNFEGSGGGGASAAAKTSGLGNYDKSATPEVGPTGRKATLVSEAWWTLLIACVLVLRSLPPVTGLGVGFAGEFSREVKQFISAVAEKGAVVPERFGCCHGPDQARGVIASFVRRAFGRTSLRGVARIRKAALAAILGGATRAGC